MKVPLSQERKEYLKQYRIKNRDKLNEYQREWNKNNRDKCRRYENNWRAKNANKVKTMNAVNGQKWASGKGRAKRNSSTRKRVAEKLKRTPIWSDLNIIQKFYEEALRISKETGIPHEVDHIIPLQGKSISGLHISHNLQIISRSQNRAKKNKLNEDISGL
jgi:hypothetical protein